MSSSRSRNLDMLDEVLRRPEWDETWVHARGAVIQRVFANGGWHCADLSGPIGDAGMTQVDLWD